MTGPRSTTAAVLVGVALVLAGCGTADGVTPAAGEQLSDLVEAARDAAAADDREAATSHLAALRSTVAELRDAEEVSADRAETILAAAAEVEALLPATEEAEPPPTRPDRDDDDADDDDDEDGDDSDDGDDGGGRDDGEGEGDRDGKGEGKGKDKDKDKDEDDGKDGDG